jgi:hypothetical protein
MDRPHLLKELDKATDRAATFALQRGFPIPVSKKSTLIGNAFVDKNENNLYDVLNFQRTLLYSDISVFDVAVTIAQRINSNELGSIRQIIYLDSRFAKYHTDMVHYLHCMKGAKKRRDIDRMTILEDKFQVAEQFAKNTRDKLSNFKRTK